MSGNITKERAKSAAAKTDTSRTVESSSGAKTSAHLENVKKVTFKKKKGKGEEAEENSDVVETVEEKESHESEDKCNASKRNSVKQKHKA